MSAVSWQWAKANPDAAARRIRELERENAALRADKERLDWLLTYEGGSWLYWAIENGEWTPEVAASRAAIDAARKETQP